MTGRLRIAIPLFPRLTALDAVGPYEVLQRVPAFDIAVRQQRNSGGRAAVRSYAEAWPSVRA